MARFPDTVWAPLPEAGAPDGYEKTQFIVHSTGDNGTAAATARYFGGTTPNESTLIVGQGPQDPTLQIMDSTDRADANMSASIRAISVEVVGDGVGGYNAWQRSEIIRLGIDARKLHPKIAPRVIPSESEPGYGWHVMFGAPGPWAGAAKVCPGKQRIKELQTDIFPAIFSGAYQEDDMFTDQDRQDLQTLKTVMQWGFDTTLGKGPAFASAGELTARVRAIHAAVADPSALATALRAKLGDLAGGSQPVSQEMLEAALRKVLGSLDA